MIELKLTTGEERLLIPVRNSNGQYELVDNTNTVQMVVVLKNTHIEVIDKCNIDIDAYNKEDLSSRLDLLAVEIIENEQSGIEHNEYEDRIEVKFKCKHDDHILKHENIYYHDHYISLCKSENNEAITAIMQYIEQCESYNFDITNDIVFEQEFPTYNVGFMGIDFPSIKNIGIDKKRQITDIDSYEDCKIHYHRKLLVRCDNNKVVYHLRCLFPDYKFEQDAVDDIIYWKNAKPSFVKDILDLLPDVKEHPFIGGKGKTEVLKNQEGVASKHINDEHRLQYSLKNGQINICRCRGHYV